MIARLICKLLGHKRGKPAGEMGGKRIFKCPRCERETSYKAKAAA